MTEGSIGNTVSGDLLRGYVERLEKLSEDKKAVGDDEKVVFAEAKSAGFDPRYIRAILKLRRKSPSEREEDDAMLDLYASAIGMARETPLFRHVQGMGVDVAARENVIEALKLLAPMDGEITIKVGSAPRMRLSRDRDGVRIEEVPDAPPAQAGAPPAERGAQARGMKEPVPNCTPEQAFDIGRQARRDDKPVIANPFPWDDPRRRHWDEGWRAEDGGDGMGPK